MASQSADTVHFQALHVLIRQFCRQVFLYRTASHNINSSLQFFLSLGGLSYLVWIRTGHIFLKHCLISLKLLVKTTRVGDQIGLAYRSYSDVMIIHSNYTSTEYFV